jgi:hypothetical protein
LSSLRSWWSARLAIRAVTDVRRRASALKPDEVYALTAYLLFKNGVIREDEVVDLQSLPKVAMPNCQGFALPAQEWKHGMPRLQNYP